MRIYNNNFFYTKILKKTEMFITKVSRPTRYDTNVPKKGSLAGRLVGVSFHAISNS